VYLLEEWPRGQGILTKEGIEQCSKLGSVLRDKMLHEYNLFDAHIIPEQVEIWSTDKHRVLESTKTFLKSFIIESKFTNIHIVNKKQEYFLGDQITKCKE